MATPLQGLTRSISAHRATANVKGLTHHANYLYDMNRHHSVRKCPSLFKTIATSMPGLGAVLTFTLIALLPELGKMSRKQIAVLASRGQLDVV
jgi:hypothetical protein